MLQLLYIFKTMVPGKFQEKDYCNK